MSGIHYVYEHWRPDTDVCFYVGKGSGRRANVMYGRDQQHRRIQAKLASNGMCVEVRLVFDGLTEKEALLQERRRIKFWKSFGVELVNRTDGGEGPTNPCEETREKMRAAKVGRKLTDEHKAKIAAATKVALANPEIRAKLKKAQNTPKAKEHSRNLHKHVLRTKEHYEKVSAALTGKKLSPEHIEKTRQGNLGRKQSKEEIEKRRTSNTGKKRSEEFRARMRAAWTPERKAAQAIKMAANKEQLEKMAAINIGNKHTLGLKHSDETRSKMRDAHSRRLTHKEGIQK